MKRAFVSYRREDYDRAMAIRRGLQWRLIGAFVDVASLHGGTYQKQLRRAIAQRSHFVVVLSPGSVTPRPTERIDWLRREIEVAIITDRTIVPIFDDMFDHAELRKHLPTEMADAIESAEGLTWTKDGLDFARMNRLARLIRGRRLWPRVLAVVAVLALSYAILAVSSDLWPFTPDPTTTTGPQSPEERFALRPDDDLAVGQSLVSADGRHTLTMDPTGRLIGRTEGVAEPWFWVPADDTAVRANSFAYMGGDANFVIYGSRDSQGNPIDARWNLQTEEYPDGAHVEVRDIDGEGYVVLVGTDDQIIDTFQRPHAAAGGAPAAPPDASPPTSPASSTAQSVEPSAPTTAVTEPVPTVHGQTFATAEERLEGDPYRYRVDMHTEPSSAISVGRVTRTVPAAGQPLAPGSAIDVYVSSGV